VIFYTAVVVVELSTSDCLPEQGKGAVASSVRGHWPHGKKKKKKKPDQNNGQVKELLQNWQKNMQ